MLTRDEVLRCQTRAVYLANVDGLELCAMALALLDVADLVPGEGPLIERVRDLVGRAEHCQ